MIENDMIDYLGELIVIANNVTILSKRTMITPTDQVEKMAEAQGKMAALRSRKIKQCTRDFQDIIDTKQDRMTKQESRGKIVDDFFDFTFIFPPQLFGHDLSFPHSEQSGQEPPGPKMIPSPQQLPL